MSNRAHLETARTALAAIQADIKAKNMMIDAEETHGADFGRRPDDMAECETILESMAEEIDRLDFLL